MQNATLRRSIPLSKAIPADGPDVRPAPDAGAGRGFRAAYAAAAAASAARQAASPPR